MHDLEFDHLHVQPGDEINETAWSADNVELTTVGIDIGSSTSHLMFARVHLQRLGTATEHAWLVTLLASPVGRAFNGSTVTLDGARDNWWGAWPPAGLADE